MARPDISDQRRAEIVDAFSECVTELGLDASTLQRVADRAGVHKSIIRHYVGSRDDLVTALVGRSLDRYRAASDAALTGAGNDPRRRLDAYVDSLFIDEAPYEGALFSALIRQGSPHRAAGALVDEQLRREGARLIELLAAAHPDAAPDVLAVIADGIGAMSLAASESMGATPTEAHRLRLASHRLAATAVR